MAILQAIYIERNGGKSMAQTTEIEISSDESAEAGLNRLRELLGAGYIKEARSLLAKLHSLYLLDVEVDRYVRLLSRPTFRKVNIPQEDRRSFRKEFDWLKEHAHEYPGRWLAVYDGELVASGEHFREVRETAFNALHKEIALMHYQPKD